MSVRSQQTDQFPPITDILFNTAASQSDPTPIATVCRTAFELMALAVIVTDRFGGVRYMNAAAERLLDYRLTEVFGWALPALFTSRDELWKCIDTGLQRLHQDGANQTVTLYRRAHGPIRVAIDGLDLPAVLGKGFALKAIAEGSPQPQPMPHHEIRACEEVTTMFDSRWGKRNPIEARVVFRGADGSEIPGVIRNVSHSGIFVQTLRPHQIQSCVVISLLSKDEPGRCLYQTAAIVVHRQLDGIGVMLPEGAGHIIGALCQTTAETQAATG